MAANCACDSVDAVVSKYDGTEELDDEVATMARRAAQAASDRRKRIREYGDGPTTDDVDADALASLDYHLEQIATWTPGFTGAMLFRGPEATPLVSLITSGEREAMRRALVHKAASIRDEMTLTERDATGAFVDSVTSTTRGAVLANVLGDDLLVVAIEGSPAPVADAWKAMRDQRHGIEEAAGALLSE